MNQINPAIIAKGPQRVVCLSTETVDILYRLGQADRIVGISGFTVHPPEARREKPKVSAYTSAKIDKIIALEPDLILGFSDLQADLMAELARAGFEVHVFNQRDIEGILGVIATLGRWFDCGAAAKKLLEQLQRHMESVHQKCLSNHRPRVYFEEWDDPMMCGIEWVSELIELAGGEDVFADRARSPSAKGRIIQNHEVVAKDPEIIIGSWCGKKFQPRSVIERPGLANVSAVQHQQLAEIKSADILQPGPIALTEGLDQLARIIQAVHRS